jgi:hypothetical protein
MMEEPQKAQKAQKNTLLELNKNFLIKKSGEYFIKVAPYSILFTYFLLIGIVGDALGEGI